MKLLFVKRSLAWPRSSGHDVYTYHMMKCCAQLGHQVALATVGEMGVEALDGAGLQSHIVLAGTSRTAPAGTAVPYSRLQERWRSYWGVEQHIVQRLRSELTAFGADALISVGPEALAYLPAAGDNVVRIWYAADEWVRHHLTLVQPHCRSTWRHLKAAAIMGAYERSYASVTDRAWVVSDEEQRAMRWFAGVKNVDVVPIGVDADFYSPAPGVPTPRTAVFWGRLDFEPNIQALTWFCDEIWPMVKAVEPEAVFTIIGFNPSDAVRGLTRHAGVVLKPNLPDIRLEVARHAAVALPFISGGGVKNKLLEAAALAKPILCSPRALSGLTLPAEGQLTVSDTADEWVRALRDLWSAPESAVSRGAAARRWVMSRHSWAAAATAGLKGIEASEMRRMA